MCVRVCGRACHGLAGCNETHARTVYKSQHHSPTRTCDLGLKRVHGRPIPVDDRQQLGVLLNVVGAVAPAQEQRLHAGHQWRCRQRASSSALAEVHLDEAQILGGVISLHHGGGAIGGVRGIRPGRLVARALRTAAAAAMQQWSTEGWQRGLHTPGLHLSCQPTHPPPFTLHPHLGHTGAGIHAGPLRHDGPCRGGRVQKGVRVAANDDVQPLDLLRCGQVIGVA